MVGVVLGAVQYHSDREYIESFALLVHRIMFNCLKAA